MKWRKAGSESPTPANPPIRQRKRTRTGEASAAAAGTSTSSSSSPPLGPPLPALGPSSSSCTVTEATLGSAPSSRTRSSHSSPQKKARLHSKTRDGGAQHPQQQPQAEPSLPNPRAIIGAGN